MLIFFSNITLKISRVVLRHCKPSREGEEKQWIMKWKICHGFTIDNRCTFRMRIVFYYGHFLFQRHVSVIKIEFQYEISNEYQFNVFDILSHEKIIPPKAEVVY